MSKKNDSIYINRELSWLGFNERVLQEAEDKNVPLLERMKFVSIFGTNLDEFFMVRMGSLYDQSVFHPDELENKCNMSASEQIEAACAAIVPLLERKDKCFKAILAELKQAGIHKIDFSKISPTNESKLRKYFKSEILPLLSPQLIDKHHPFPFLKNKDLYVAVHMESKSDNPKLGIVPIDTQFERVFFINTSKGIYFVLAEELIYHFAGDIFTKYTFINKWLFRVTRNADIDANEALYDQDMDWRDVMQELIKRRRRLAAVRLQVNKPLTDDVTKFFCTNLKLKKYQIFTEKSPFDVSFAFVLEHKFEKTHPELLNDTLTPVQTNALARGDSVMDYVQKRDLFLAYPYHSIKPFIRLLEEAADDPLVTSIKITLYRVAKNSQILSALLKAVENGKEVTAVLELRARFDEQNNIDWSKQLESAGCNILYGLDDFKVHSKLLLITRRNGSEQEYITQIGTGNYNEKTAELYTDLCVITSDREIGSEAVNVFNNLMMGQAVERSNKLLVAPNCLSSRIIDFIDEQIVLAQAGGDAAIKIKCNSITDKQLIDKLLEAGRAGVKVTLIVRGICCFKAGVPGESDNIVVKSIVGRLLEHSRIYIFGTGDNCSIYISSADLMTRNTHRRVEVAAPITDEYNKQIILKMFDIMDHDNVKARVMQSDGNYVRADSDGEDKLDSQRYFYEMFASEEPPHLDDDEYANYEAVSDVIEDDGDDDDIGIIDDEPDDDLYEGDDSDAEEDDELTDDTSDEEESDDEDGEDADEEDESDEYEDVIIEQPKSEPKPEPRRRPQRLPQDTAPRQRAGAQAHKQRVAPSIPVSRTQRHAPPSERQRMREQEALMEVKNEGYIKHDDNTGKKSLWARFWAWFDKD